MTVLRTLEHIDLSFAQSLAASLTFLQTRAKTISVANALSEMNL